jgi:hypothetical protein
MDGWFCAAVVVRRNDGVAGVIFEFGRSAVTCGHGVFVKFLVGMAGV